MIDRNTIIEALKEKLYELPYVHALWLEGSDANGTLDEYSDIDVVMDIDDEAEMQAIEAVERILAGISTLDYRHVMQHGHPKLRQRIYHLSDTSPYLMIDFCWQLHSRDPKESCFIRESRVEFPLVLFDKSGVISYKDLDIDEYRADNENRYKECLYRYTQHDRVRKYVLRGHYLEAYAYYNRYVLEPLIDMLRILYTPAYAYYYLIHISSHLPKEQVHTLEHFARISSLADISERTDEAMEWFARLDQQIKERYGHMRHGDGSTGAVTQCANGPVPVAH